MLKGWVGKVFGQWVFGGQSRARAPLEPLEKELIVIDRRQHERLSTSIRVEMTHPSFGTIVGFTQDISDGGARVLVENQPKPPVGTRVMVKFKKMVGPINADPVPMRVMHQLRNTVGLMFD